MHGITVMEAATNVVALKQVESAIPCVIGTAPLHLGSERSSGKPIIAYSYEEAAALLGYSDDWKTYTLSESMHVLFRVFGVSPVVFVNALDLKENTKKIANGTLTDSEDGTLLLKEKGVLLETLKLGSFVNGTDYTARHNGEGYVVITVKNEELTAVTAAEYTMLDPVTVTDNDVVNALDAVDYAYHAAGVIPSALIAPGHSHTQTVALALAAKAKKFDTVFSAVAAVDIEVNTETYNDVAESAKDKADTYLVQCWPCAPLDDEHVVHRSTIYAGMCATTDADYGNIPYASPSNRPLPFGGLCTEDGKTISLNLAQANALENAGVYTAVRLDTWKAWGTYTSAINASTDPKDIFIAVRRMLNWHKNTFTVNYFSKVDTPANTRLIETLVDNENKRIDGLKAIGAVAGGRMQFLDAENPVGNVMAGKLKFRQKLGFWPPAREIENVIEIDADLVKSALGGE